MTNVKSKCKVIEKLPVSLTAIGNWEKAKETGAVCIAPGFLDTEHAAIVSDHVFAFITRRPEIAFSGNTQIAAPLLKSSL